MPKHRHEMLVATGDPAATDTAAYASRVEAREETS